MKTKQKKVEQSKQSTLMKEINNAVDVMLLKTPKYYELSLQLNKKNTKKTLVLIFPLSQNFSMNIICSIRKKFNQS